jgi:O-acetyl-ADP-ribose deacetylase (regulator of RNase III)
MNFTHDMNDGHTLFVFGSNEAGLHGGGAAREAHIYWGAQIGQGFGEAGFSFAIPTMDWRLQALPLSVIEHYVKRFLAFVEVHPTTRFLVTAIGTGICGYNAAEIAPMFKDAPANCVLPDGWRK